jgi:hypothetical protein
VLGSILVREYYENTTLFGCETLGNDVVIHFKEPLKRVELSDAEIGLVVFYRCSLP